MIILQIQKRDVLYFIDTFLIFFCSGQLIKTQAMASNNKVYT